MRATLHDADEFISEIIRLRNISNSQRQEFHDKIIHWVDKVPLLNGGIGESLTFVLPTKGCKYALAKHGGCTMCTLPNDNPMNPTKELLDSLPERTMEIFEHKGGSDRFKAVKFYTSGSFIDRWELPIDIRDKILEIFRDKVDEITIETRCEFVTRKTLDQLSSIINPGKLIVAIGQETTNDEINKRSINKGHTHKQFKRAVDLLKEYNFIVKGYILLKPIFVSEILALSDAIQTAKDMVKLGVDIISINPSYIGKLTLMEKLFYESNYQPPWLWTVLIAAKKIKQIAGDIPVIADPVAAGTQRGARNCGSCDREFKDKLKEFSASQNLELLDLHCECYENYKASVQEDIAGNGYCNYFTTSRKY